MTINQNLLPSSKYSLKSPYSMTAEFITVHNTSNDASAKNEISYMVTNNLATSFHFAVDDKEVWQGLPLNRNGFHAGDGATGTGNRKTIGIEICYSKLGGERFEAAERLAAQLIAKLLKERNWGIERVKKHQDWSGKYCPHRTLDMGWIRYLNIIKGYLEGDTMDYQKLYDEARLARDAWWNNMTRLAAAASVTGFTNENANAKVTEAIKRIENLYAERNKLIQSEKELAVKLSDCQARPPVIVEKIVEVVKEVPVEIIKEVPVEVIREVPVSSESLGAKTLISLALQAILDRRW
jgi:N-acetylmuramoyl-L-alanine amidase CwlA